jgi:hypothetical protein
LLGNKGKTALLAGASALLGILFLELAVRLIEPREVLREYFERGDSILNHKFIPGAHGRHKTLEFDAAYAINSLGLRNDEIPRDKPAGVRRLLMLGDSFTEGNGVQASETFSSRLQAKLDQSEAGRKWQVINAGVGSYSPLLELLYLENGGLALQPDLVVLNFDLSDINDDIRYSRLATFDASGDPVAVRQENDSAPGSWPMAVLVGIKDFFKQHLRLYNFTKRRLVGLFAPRRAPNLSGDVRVDKYGLLRGDADDSAFALSYKYLLKARDVLAARGIDFWVTVYPMGNQISPREWSRGRVYWGFEPGKVYPTRPQALVADFCRRNGIRVVDMCDDFKAAARTAYPLYYEYDGHWKAAGHQVVADVLYRELAPYLQSREAREQAKQAPAAGR